MSGPGPEGAEGTERTLERQQACLCLPTLTPRLGPRLVFNGRRQTDTSVQVGSRVLGRGDDHKTPAPVRPAPTSGTKSDTVPRQSGLPCSLLAVRDPRALSGPPCPAPRRRFIRQQLHRPAVVSSADTQRGEGAAGRVQLRAARPSTTQRRASRLGLGRAGPAGGRSPGVSAGPSPEAQPRTQPPPRACSLSEGALS